MQQKKLNTTQYHISIKIIQKLTQIQNPFKKNSNKTHKNH